jgi:diguanylate cyclase (GGDEF)-like protein/PAS domain S-box-containing protein
MVKKMIPQRIQSMHLKSDQPFARDKTSRQENIKPLESDTRAKALLEAIPDFMFVFNQAGQFIDYKAPNDTLLLMPPEQFLNKYTRDVLPPDLADLTLEKVRTVIETGTAQHYEYELLVDGETRHYESRMVRCGNNEALSIVREITTQKNMRKELETIKAFNESIVQGIDEGIAINRITGEMDFVNPALARMLGYGVDEITGQHWRFIVPEEQLKIIEEADQRRQQGLTDRYESWLKHKNGSLIPVQISASPVYDQNNGRVSQTMAVITNISSIKLTEAMLAEKNIALQLLNSYAIEQSATMDYSSLQVLILEQLKQYTGALMIAFSEFQADRSTLIIRKVKTEQRWLNLALKLIGGEIQGFEAPINEADYNEITSDVVTRYDSLTEITGGAVPEIASSALKIATGVNRLVGLSHLIEGHLFGTTVFALKQGHEEPSRDFLEAYAHITAISLRRLQAKEKLIYYSFNDRLTNLYNRNYLENEINRLDTYRQLPISIIMADLNGLKLINDTYGHASGDEMLRTAAAIIKKSCRGEDIVGRWGGDEFVVLLPQTGLTRAAQIARRITAGYKSASVQGIPLSIALGLAEKSNPEQSLTAVMKIAEDEMYRDKLTESSSSKSAVVSALLKTLAAKSCETEEHTRRMQNIALKIGERLNLPDSELKRLVLLITLHDIGKINLPEEILVKESSLTEMEWELVKKHPETGYRIARATEEFARVAEGILSHHERWDGSGYPQGLKGEEIPLLARITTIADAYEVMSNGRPYKPAMDKNEIIAEFQRCAGSHFDPHLTKILLTLI